MTALRSLIDKLSGLKHSDDFIAAIPELERNLHLLEKTASDLANQLETALFESPDQADTIRKAIAENRDQRETLLAAISGATKRKAAAVEREKQAAVENLAEKGKELQKEIRANYIRLHDLFRSAVDVIRSIRRSKVKLQEVRSAIVDSGGRCSDLSDPFNLLSNLVGSNGHGDPISSTLIDYLEPHAHPNGPILARMKDVKL